MRAKRGLVILCYLKGPFKPLTEQKKKGLRGRRNPTQLPVGGFLWLFRQACVWSPAHKLLLFCGPDSGSNWGTQRGQAQLCQVLSGQLLFYQLQPPPPFNCTCTQTTCSFGCSMTVNSPMEAQRWATTAPSTQLSLSHASGLQMCLCVNSELIWQAHSHPHTHTQPIQHLQIELALDGEFSEIKRDKKKTGGRSCNSLSHVAGSKPSGGKTACHISWRQFAPLKTARSSFHSRACVGVRF